MRSTMFIFAAALLAGCEQAPEQAAEQPVEAAPLGEVEAKEGVTITDARIVLPVVDGRPGAAYMTLANDTATAVEVAAIHVEGAERVELHESSMEGGAMSMEKVEAITAPAAGTVELQQGGLHAMVFGLSPDFDGESMEVTVIFADGDKTSLDAPVTTIAENGS